MVFFSDRQVGQPSDIAVSTASNRKRLPARGLRRLPMRFVRSDDGSAAIEFAIVAPILFAIFGFIMEIGLSYIVNTTMDHALDRTARQIKTGELAFQFQAPTSEELEGLDEDEVQELMNDREDEQRQASLAAFREALCDNLGMVATRGSGALLDCNNLLVDVRSVAGWDQSPTDPDREIENEGTEEEQLGALNADDFSFQPGGRLSVNVVRVFYEWDTFIKLNHADSSTWVGDKRMLRSTTAFLSEPF